jgi:hypothetical protein
MFDIHTTTNGELRIQRDRLKRLVEDQKNEEGAAIGHGRAVLENRRQLRAIREEMERRQPIVSVSED